MRHPNDNSFADRRKTADAAKLQLLAKYASATTSNEPAIQERRAARAAVVAAREERRAAREASKTAEAERILTESAALTAAAEAHGKAEAEARQAEINDRIARVVADQAARKAERDRRYAARKARQG